MSGSAPTMAPSANNHPTLRCLCASSEYRGESPRAPRQGAGLGGQEFRSYPGLSRARHCRPVAAPDMAGTHFSWPWGRPSEQPDGDVDQDRQRQRQKQGRHEAAGSASDDANPATARRPMAPRPEGHESLPVAVVGVVRVAAAGLRQPARHHVADGEDRGVEPDLAGAEAASVGRVNDRAGDEDADEDGEVGEELRRLERGLRLVLRRRTWARGATAPRVS